MIALPNAQAPSGIERNTSGDLAVHSVFDTIQGEGPLAGTSATFVRLFGCTLTCPACDTDYTSQKHWRSAAALQSWVASLPRRRLVVLTGGEPLRQPLWMFLRLMRMDGKIVQIETNGTFVHEGDLDELSKCEVVCSPKVPKVHPLLADHIDYWKYVVGADAVEEDGLPSSALGLPCPPARPPENTDPMRVFVQPLDTQDALQNERNLEECVRSCEKFGYRLSLQTHKIIGKE